MSIIKEALEDAKYVRAVIFEKAKSEFEFKGINGPIVALHGLGGGWAKNGFRKYMSENKVCGILTYFGDITDGLDKYIDQIDRYLTQYKNSHILGFSAGGIIALKYAEKYGWEKFKKIITIASPLFGSPPANKLKFAGKTFDELSVESDYLRKIRGINPPENKVLSIFSSIDFKAPFSDSIKLNWPSLVLNNAHSHGEIHSNYKIIEPIINIELVVVKYTNENNS